MQIQILKLCKLVKADGDTNSHKTKLSFFQSFHFYQSKFFPKNLFLCHMASRFVKMLHPKALYSNGDQVIKADGLFNVKNY